MEADDNTEKTDGKGRKWLPFLLALAAFVATYGFWPQAEHNQAVVAATLVYENSLVKADDLSRVDKAFFDLNGFVSLVYLLAVLGARPWLG